jgi:cobalt/nickel transport system permease protein
VKTVTKLWILIAALVVLSPLGLAFPRLFNSKEAWGEWGLDRIRALAGYVPRGLGRLSALWRAPFPGYAVKGAEGGTFPGLTVGYALSAALGVLITAGIALLIAAWLRKKE